MATEPSNWKMRSIFFCYSMVTLLHGYLYLFRKIGSWQVDFPSYWVAAHAVFSFGETPYGPTFSNVLSDLTHLYAHPFLYPPVSLLLLWPLSQAESIWDALLGGLVTNWIATVLCGWLLARYCKWKYSTNSWVALAVFSFFLFSQPIRINLGHGQSNILALLFLVGAMFLVMRKEILSGILLALGVTLKIYTAIALLPFMLLRKTKILLGFAMGLILLGGGSVLFLDSSLWLDWFQFVVMGSDYAGTFVSADSANISLQGLATRVGLNSQIGQLLAVFAAGFGGLAILLTKEVDATKSVFTILSLAVLLPEIAWLHYAVFLLPGALVVFFEAVKLKRWVVVAAAALNLIVLLHNPAIESVQGLGNLIWTICALFILLAGSWIMYNQ